MISPFRYKILHNTVRLEYVYCPQLTQCTIESLFTVILKQVTWSVKVLTAERADGGERGAN